MPIADQMLAATLYVVNLSATVYLVTLELRQTVTELRMHVPYHPVDQIHFVKWNLAMLYVVPVKKVL